MNESEEIRAKLRKIGETYSAFLKEERLEDTPLARMTFLSKVKKIYTEGPADSEVERAELLGHLDLWMEETQKDMVALMSLPTRVQGPL